MEAAREVARQLRMRDIGGLVVVDFIDMRSPKHRRSVEKAMRDALKDDKARTNASRLSENGLMEINRQRLKKALQLRTHRPCPTCSGTGSIASPELVGLNILRRIETRAVTGRLGAVRVELHPELADALQNERRQELAALEREFDIRVEIIAAPDLHRAEERVTWEERGKTEEAATAPAVSAADLADGMGRQKSRRRRSKSAVIETPEAEAKDDSQPEESQPSGDSPKPRRRRRGGRRRKKSTGSQTEAANGPDTSAATDGDTAAKADGESAATTGDESKTPAKKSRRRRPRRSKKKATTTTASEEPAPPSTPDPFAY
jgi:ribonuclease E